MDSFIATVPFFTLEQRELAARVSEFAQREVEAFEHNTRGLARVLDPASAAWRDPIVSSPVRGASA